VANVNDAPVALNDTATITEAGRILYTPAEGFVGIDTFGYSIADGQGATATASVVINVSVQQ